MTPSQIAAARSLREAGYSWEMVASRLGLGLYKVHATLEPEWGARRVAQSIAAQVRRKLNRIKLPHERHGIKPKRPKRTDLHSLPMNGEVGRHAAGIHEGAMRAPLHVLAERDHRLSLPEPAFGDPRPGYSALDRKRARA